MTNMTDRITALLEAEFSPDYLDVINESHKHKNHVGDDGSGESHFRVVIGAKAFTGQTRVACHRMVYSALDEPIKQGLHALAIDVRTF